jgi:hypothetical protein
MGVFLHRPFVSLSSCWMEQIIGNLLSIIRGGNKEGSWPAQDDWCCFDPHWLKVGEYNQHAACQPVKAPEFGPSAVRFGPYYLVIMDGLHGPGNAAIGSYYMGLLKTTGPSAPLYKGLKHLSTKIAWDKRLIYPLFYPYPPHLSPTKFWLLKFHPIPTMTYILRQNLNASIPCIKFVYTVNVCGARWLSYCLAWIEKKCIVLTIISSHRIWRGRLDRLTARPAWSQQKHMHCTTVSFCDLRMQPIPPKQGWNSINTSNIG